MEAGEGRSGAQLSETELNRLLEVGRALVSNLDLESVLGQVLRTARELTRARYAALGILDEDKNELERFLYIGIDEETRRAIGPLPRGRGVLGELIRDPRPRRLHDVAEHPRSYGFPPGHPPMRAFLGVPITIRGKAYGNLYLTDKEGGADFSESDEHLVVVLSEWAAVGIDNARLYQNVERRRAELERAVRGLEATSAIARAVGFETELGRVLELIAKRGRAMSDARAFLVLLHEDDALCVVAAAGEVDGCMVGADLRVDGSLAGMVMTSGAAHRVPDLKTRVGHGLERVAGGATSAAVVPLGFRGKARGVLIAFDRLRDQLAFDEEDEHLLTSFAASAAIAIATAQSVGAEQLRLSLRAAEEERARWARELHDDTLQELGALKMMLESLQKTSDAAPAQSSIGGALSQIDLSIRNLQALITELRPAALDEIGLEAALDALLARVRASSGLVLETHVSLALEEGRSGTRLDPEIERALYRIVQEALTNAMKHASADRVTIELVEGDTSVALVVSDDGSGFDPEQLTGGFGLVSMRDRVSLVDGSLSIDAAVGRGTTVRAEVPARHREPLAAAEPA
jgi:two-component system, NarL family, sensor histidine kinase DevS